MSAVLLDGHIDLQCPHCGITARKPLLRDPNTELPMFEGEFHQCPKLGVIAPLVQAGIACKVETIVREDYIGSDLVHWDSQGRPVMAVETVRDDGTDRVVLAPTAVGNLGV